MPKLKNFPFPFHTESTPKAPKRSIASIIIGGLTVIAMAAFFPKTRFDIFNYKLNDITRTSIIAPFDFPILKSEKELERDRNEALRQVAFIFIQDKKNEESTLNALRQFFDELDRIRAAKNKYEETKRLSLSRKSEENQSLLIADSLAFQAALNKFRNQYRLEKNSAILQTFILDYPKSIAVNPNVLYTQLKQILSDLYALLILDIPKKDILSNQIVIRENGEEIIENLDQVMSIEEAWTKAKISLQARLANNPAEVVTACYDILTLFLKPNLIYQKESTEKRQAEAINKVPLSKGIILENEKIVDANTKITPEIYQKLESLSKEQARRANIHGRWRTNVPLIGDSILFLEQIGLVGIIYAFFMAFLIAYKPEIPHNPRMVLLIGIIFTLQSLLAYLFTSRIGISGYAIPITLAAMTLTILFDSKLAFMGIVTLSLIIGAQLGGSLNFIIASIFVSIFAIFSVRQLRKRSQIFKAIIYIVLGYLFTITLTELLKFSSTTEILNHLLFATINGILSPVLTYGMIGLLEKPFGITTDLTLLELADFNHPLLKLLSREATGTFTHCVTVGNLAEAAADAIGANALLARVGAYYHDIGKITKPEYFIENQAFDYNRHDKLTPNLSAIIIINHVKEGLRLAREYKLPQAVIDFIPSHHGTTRVEYFYNKALEQADDPTAINESDFRYPGPKPRTKETGIVMICETIEAVCRSLEKPTVAAIEKVIDTITDNRLREGQFDECPLTLADFKKIKGNIKEGTGILPILKGIHHLRVEYPGQEDYLNDDKENNKV